MNIEYYKCRRCDYWRTVETVGMVVSVPHCPVCRSKLHKFTPIQTELKIAQKKRKKG